MARGKGRKNESRGKARVQRELGKPVGGRTGGDRESSPARRRARTANAARNADVIEPPRTPPRGGTKIGRYGDE